MDDLISRQTAISAICNACGKIDCDKMDKCEKLQLPPANSSEIPNNSDTISRQAAIDALDCINGVEEVLRSLPTIQPEPQWIPVERELPEPRIDVWVNSDLGQMVGYYDEMVELWYGRDYLELIVNAWMPLPEPYQKGSTP